MALGVITEEISTSAATYEYSKPADTWLQGLEVRSDEAQFVSLGTTPGGNEIDGPVAIAAGDAWTSKSANLTSFTPETLYFSGLAGNNSIKIWLLGNI